MKFVLRSILLLFFSCTQVLADSVQHRVSGTGGVEYDSNPRLLTEDEIDAWRGIFEPSYELLWRDGRYEVDANAAVRLERSSEKDISDDREDPRLSLSASRAHQGGSVYSELSYRKDSTRISELEDTGRTFTDDTRTQFGFDLGAEHKLSARTDVIVDLSYQDVSFDGDGLADFETGDLTGRLSYALSKSNSIWVEALAASYSTDEVGVDDSDALGLTVGLDRSISEQWQVELFSGLMDISGNSDRTDWVGGVGANYSGDRANFEASYARSSTASAAGGFEEADTVVARYVYSLSEVTTVTVMGRWRENQREGLGETYSAELRFDRRLSPAWSLGFSFVQRGTEVEESADGQVYSVLVTYRPPTS